MRLPDAGGSCWLDGEQVATGALPLAAADPAVQTGFGLFETLALREGRLLDLEPHLARLARGASRIGLVLPDLDRVRDVVRRAAGDEARPWAWLKLIVWRSGRWLVYTGGMDRADEGRAASAVLLPWRRSTREALAGLKTLNRAAEILGLEEARRRGADEGLWANTRGHLIEGCTTNLFVVQGGALFTAGTAEGVLPGIVREQVLKVAAELRLRVHAGKLRLRRLEQAREAFLTSSLCGVRPLVRFEGRLLAGGAAGPVTLRLAREIGRRHRAGGG